MSLCYNKNNMGVIQPSVDLGTVRCRPEVPMLIRTALPQDVEAILLHDPWITRETACRKANDKQLFAAIEDGRLTGWLRYGLFWDNTPFLNMLYVLEEYRGKGIGTRLTEYWENEMKKLGYHLLLTSTAQPEFAQHFYVKLGYQAVGGFLLAPEPYEMILAKQL